MSGWWLVDCEDDIGWVPASFIKPVGGENDNDDDDITYESFPPGRGRVSLIQVCIKLFKNIKKTK